MTDITSRRHWIMQMREGQLRLNSLALDGGRPYVEARLWRAPNETDLSWSGDAARGVAGRKWRTSLVNDAGRVARKIDQYIFGRAISRKNADEAFLADCTGRGETARAFMERVNDAVTCGRWCCPQDGGFIGSAGCTHPNHRHSELVRRILSGEKPTTIPEEQATEALKEGFFVDGEGGERVGFGQRLLRHIESHDAKDSGNRKRALEFAVHTVKNPDAKETNHRDTKGRTAFAKRFDKFGMLVLADKVSGEVMDVFTIIPKRNKKGNANG